MPSGAVACGAVGAIACSVCGRAFHCADSDASGVAGRTLTTLQLTQELVEAQQDRDLHRRQVKALAHQITAGQHLHPALLERLQDAVAFLFVHASVDVAGRVACLPEVFGHVHRVSHAHAERDSLLA